MPNFLAVVVVDPRVDLMSPEDRSVVISVIRSDPITRSQNEDSAIVNIS